MEETWELAVVTKFGTFIFPVMLLAGCASPNSGGIPNLVSKSNLEQMANVSWQDAISRMGLSEDIAAKARFETIANKVIAASYLSDEDWDIKLLKGDNPFIFSLPGNRLGARAIEQMSDDRIASMTAFGIASLELNHAQQRVSRQVLGNALLSTGSLLGGGKATERQRKLSKLGVNQPPLPPTVEMRKAATQRAEEIIIKAGFTPDFFVSTNPLSRGGPLK